jgi:hypothetical protein
MRSFTVYADTSVFGGVFDVEFEEPSKMFFDLVRIDKFQLRVSGITAVEIERAPQHVLDFFNEHLPSMEVIPITKEVITLRDAYLEHGIVTPNYIEDATHVAAASIAEVDIIVSWNFRHIVHFEKIRLYNAVNTLHNYPELEIRSPSEVIDYEE